MTICVLIVNLTSRKMPKWQLRNRYLLRHYRLLFEQWVWLSRDLSDNSFNQTVYFSHIINSTAFKRNPITNQFPLICNYSLPWMFVPYSLEFAYKTQHNQLFPTARGKAELALFSFVISGFHDMDHHRVARCCPYGHCWSHVRHLAVPVSEKDKG